MGKISVIEKSETYVITFKYDPDIVSLIKNVPVRDYVPSSKKWVIPKNMLGHLLNQFKGTKYEDDIVIVSEEDINHDTFLVKTSKIPNVNISNITTYVQEGYSLYKHQEDFLKWALYRQLQEKNLSGFLLADDPGLGKTIETMNLALYNKRNYKFKHCLIICCTNSAKYNWVFDIEKHTNQNYHPYLLGTRLTKKGTIKKGDIPSKDKYDDLCNMTKYGGDTPLPYFIVTNIELLQYRSGKHFLVTEKLIELINSGQINMVLIDEIHKNASPSSIQGKQLLKIKEKTQNRCMWIPMTGTPIVNRPTDVFVPLKLTDSIGCKSYYSFIGTYCVTGGYGITDIIGYKNMNQLNAILQDNMLRRLKGDVLDLPEAIFIDRYVENTSYQRKLYNSLCKELKENKTAILESLNPLSQFLKLRQVNGSPELVDDSLTIDDSYLDKNAKLRELLSILCEISERGEKVVIFSNWVKPLNTLYKFISKEYGICRYDGTMSSSERNAEKYKFITDPRYTVFLGTVGAAGTSHTLTVANNVIFYDEPWTYADKQQAWERCYRIGTQSNVNVYTLLSLDTVDQKVHDIVYTKQCISNYIVDNSIDLRSHPELFDILLGN